MIGRPGRSGRSAVGRVGGIIAAVFAGWLLTAPGANAALVGSDEVTAPAAATSTPTPEPTATPRVTSTPGTPGGDDTSTTMILTISGFTVLAMAGLVLLLRTGLRSRDNED